jgi:hypothetical protein
MDILEVKYPEKDIRKLLKILSFNNNPVQIVGTGALKSQYYWADIDLLSKITKKASINDSYLLFLDILDNVKNEPNLFFIEFKIQDKEGNKKKFFNMNEFTQDEFTKHFNNNIELCKMDLIIFLKGTFIEVSIIYFFSDKQLDLKEYVKVLLKDQAEYYKEKKYYKSLKRLLVANKYLDVPDRELILSITKLFNSEIGKLYQLKNQIDAGLIFYDKYKNDKYLKVFVNNKGLRGITVDELRKLSDDYDKLINKEGLSFYKYYGLKAGKLPKYNSVQPKYNYNNISL